LIPLSLLKRSEFFGLLREADKYSHRIMFASHYTKVRELTSVFFTQKKLLYRVYYQNLEKIP